MQDNEARTYQEWKQLGFYVNKGEKAKLRTKSGTPLFNRSQVVDSANPAEKKQKNQQFIVKPKVFQNGNSKERVIKFRSQQNRADSLPKDHGEYVTDKDGNIIGKRAYHRSTTSDGWEKHTVYPNGSGVWHSGGPGGDLSYDEFGNT